MQAYLPWIWLGLIALFGVLEGATLQLVSIWFCVGSFAALAASLLGAEAWLQFVVFAVVSALALVVSRTLFRDRPAAAAGAHQCRYGHRQGGRCPAGHFPG